MSGIFLPRRVDSILRPTAKSTDDEWRLPLSGSAQCYVNDSANMFALYCTTINVDCNVSRRRVYSQSSAVYLPSFGQLKVKRQRRLKCHNLRINVLQWPAGKSLQSCCQSSYSLGQLYDAFAEILSLLQLQSHPINFSSLGFMMLVVVLLLYRVACSTQSLHNTPDASDSLTMCMQTPRAW